MNWGDERIARYRRGLGAEWLAAAYLMAKGYRILARRFKTHSGEIDLIVQRGRALAFVEVKRRTTFDEAADAVTPRLRQRVAHAAELWMQRHPDLDDCSVRFDVILVARGRWPQHLEDAFRP